MKQKFRINTIRERIILYIFLSIVACGIISALIVTTVIGNQMTQKYQLNNAAATESLSSCLVPALEVYDYNQVEQVIKSFAIYDNIASISVFSDTGTFIRSAVKQNVIPAALAVEKHDITANGSVIGSFEISFSKKYIEDQIQTINGALISGLVGFLILLGVGLFIFINRSVISPIESFTRTIDQITPDRLSTRVDIKRRDEIGTLAASFNRMAADLEASRTALLKAHDELEEKVKETTAELEQRGRELEEMSRHKSQFLANMSHELRTPLNSIIGYTKFMLDGLEGDINEEQKKDLHTVYDNSKHLLSLINDLLDISRIEAGKTVLTYGTFPISDLISEVIPTMEPLARAKGLTLTHSVVPGINSLFADKAKTKQVLINILGNAIKFTNKGGVTLNVDETDSDFVFSVTDTGIGMKKEDLEVIFESFKQVGPAQTAGYEGTGLGLTISKQFIEMQGGKIWADSEINKGSTFTFTLPKKKAPGP